MNNFVSGICGKDPLRRTSVCDKLFQTQNGLDYESSRLKSNNTLKLFKRKRRFDADNTKDSDNSCGRKQKEIKKVSL